jgi:hypothetical protein
MAPALSRKHGVRLLNRSLAFQHHPCRRRRNPFFRAHNCFNLASLLGKSAREADGAAGRKLDGITYEALFYSPSLYAH